MGIEIEKVDGEELNGDHAVFRALSALDSIGDLKPKDSTPIAAFVCSDAGMHVVLQNPLRVLYRPTQRSQSPSPPFRCSPVECWCKPHLGACEEAVPIACSIYNTAWKEVSSM